ncbi:DnaJ C-terminal domain-containing protein [Chloroflexota bacterium]
MAKASDINMGNKDYYKIMGVDKKATEKEIKQAYRRLARKYHPDVNPDNKEAEQKFKEINEANEVLGDPEKRKKYDELGANWKYYEQWQQAGGRDGGQPFDWSQYGFARGARGNPGYQHHTLNEEDLEGLFGESGPFSGFHYNFAGAPDTGGRRQYRTTSRPRRGQDMEQPVEVILEEAYNGTTRVLQMRDASGKINRLEAKIPAGVQDGSRVRLAGKGTPGSGGGQTGDLYLDVRVLPHHQFERKGDDLHLKLTVPLTTAILGGEVHVPSLNGNGKVMLTIPPETQNGRSFRLKGKGMPRLQNPEQKGDLYAEVKVILPQQLSEKEKELFEELAGLRAES